MVPMKWKYVPEGFEEKAGIELRRFRSFGWDHQILVKLARIIQSHEKVLHLTQVFADWFIRKMQRNQVLVCFCMQLCSCFTG